MMVVLTKNVLYLLSYVGQYARNYIVSQYGSIVDRLFLFRFGT
jgi:hypothetical protein